MIINRFVLKYLLIYLNKKLVDIILPITQIFICLILFHCLKVFQAI